MNTINIKEKIALVNTQWHPHQIATVDDMQVILAKIKGEFVWHAHENEDELFQVIKGTLYMKFRDKTVTVKEGELIVVPKGVEHCPVTKDGEEVHLLLFEKRSIAHTGDVKHELTQANYPKI
ncbi:cupin domain-containing protein [Kordia jejudonensis]|uniref:cupin domain-containing protein n=1 Tax=Kordia jejudonensis TaxID=1348245 RepID=UPI000629C654|nr:cupin domain-containing protein [Kordia jejudonensis]